MKTRVLTGLIGTVVMLAALALPPIFFCVLMALAAAAAVVELARVIQIRYRFTVVLTAIYAASAPFWQLFKTDVPFLVPFLVTIGFTVLFVTAQLIAYPRLPTARMGLYYMMTLLSTLALASLAFLRGMAYGLFYAIVAMMIAWLCDAGAYFAGTLFGRHKLCPAISPKKTVEGLIGGLLTGILLSLLAGGICALIVKPVPVHFGRLALMALICSLLSVVGDLFASVVKRRFDVKDYGRVLPGHGGVMDRFDSLLFIAPLFFVVMTAWPLVG
ncbi:MAG: phosphatidate cytidylyltransferase [Acutalibacteraceae bacterium]|jgi:phosphatidate cytidylyltransferase